MRLRVMIAAMAAWACVAAAGAAAAGTTVLYDTGPGLGNTGLPIFGDASTFGMSAPAPSDRRGEEIPALGSRMGRVELFMSVFQPGELELQLYVSHAGSATPGLLLRDVVTNITSTHSDPEWVGIDVSKTLSNTYWLVVTTPAGSTFDGDLRLGVPNPPKRVIGFVPAVGWVPIASDEAFGMRLLAVPEPGTWAMMLLGFASLGITMRRRRLTGAQTAA